MTTCQVWMSECCECSSLSWRELDLWVSECALIGKTWLCSSRQWLILQAAALHACVCESHAPPPPHPLFHLRPHSIFSQWALVPAYLKWMVLPWSGSAACYDDCKYGSTVPGGYTICTCSFVFEYDSKYRPTPTFLSSPPPPPCPFLSVSSTFALVLFL